jgi:hypothetical protein
MTPLAFLLLSVLSILQAIVVSSLVMGFHREPPRWKALLLIFLGGPIVWIVVLLMFIPFEDMLVSLRDWFQN